MSARELSVLLAPATRPVGWTLLLRALSLAG